MFDKQFAQIERLSYVAGEQALCLEKGSLSSRIFHPFLKQRACSQATGMLLTDSVFFSSSTIAMQVKNLITV